MDACMEIGPRVAMMMIVVIDLVDAISLTIVRFLSRECALQSGLLGLKTSYARANQLPSAVLTAKLRETAILTNLQQVRAL